MIPLLSRGGIILKLRTMASDEANQTRLEQESRGTDGGEKEKGEDLTRGPLADMPANEQLTLPCRLSFFLIDTLLLCFSRSGAVSQQPQRPDRPVRGGQTL